MIELKKKQELANISINKLEKRIKDLESLTFKLNERITEENLKRNELNNAQVFFSENNNSQIKTIKESIEQLATIFNTSLNETKKTLNEEINNKTSSLKNILDDKSKLIDEVINSKKIENNDFQSSIKDLDLKFDNIQNELKLIKEQLNENDKRHENLENIVKNNHSFLEEQIDSINKQFIIIEKESKINKTFKTNINKDLANLESEIREKNELINKIKLDYDSYMDSFEEKLNKYYSSFREESDKLEKMQGEIYTHLDLNDNKFISKIKELSEYFNKEITLQQNEIENFEKHILEEHSHFSDFFQEKIKNVENSMNKNFSFSDEDNRQIKNIINNLKEENETLKLKISDDINELNKFHNKKNDILLKILMNNNLVPPDFDYKAFCSWNYYKEDNELNSSSYRNSNYNNYNKNYNDN